MPWPSPASVAATLSRMWFAPRPSHSMPGPPLARWPATMWRPTPISGLATTEASTHCAVRVGKVPALCGGPMKRTVASSGVWMVSGRRRAPSVNTNTFARESHMDIMAAKAGVDPVEFRLRHLTDVRMKRVLETVAKRFGWKSGKAPSGHGQGVALGMDVGTYAATCAEVSVDKATGAVKVHRMVAAMDPGFAVNPDGALQQMEGATTMGLGYALTEELRFTGGEIHDHNFDTYVLPRFSGVPKIECILVETPGTPAQGCAEPPVVTVGAVLANAIFDATSARVLQLPMTLERVKLALSRV